MEALLRPSALDDGKSFGTVRYALGAGGVNISGGYYTGGVAITGTTLTLPVQKTEDHKEAGIGTVSITIISQNYKDMDATINVRSVNGTPVTITGVSVAGREYNGEAAECTGTPQAVDGSGNTVMISGTDYQYTWLTADGAKLDEAPKNAGSYQLTVSVDNGAICADEVAEDGMVSIAFTHASDYVIVVDRETEEDSSVLEVAQPEETGGNDSNVPPESPKTVTEKKNVLWPALAGVLVLAGIVFAGVFVWKKKEENDSSGKEEK